MLKITVTIALPRWLMGREKNWELDRDGEAFRELPLVKRASVCVHRACIISIRLNYRLECEHFVL